MAFLLQANFYLPIKPGSHWGDRGHWYYAITPTAHQSGWHRSTCLKAYLEKSTPSSKNTKTVARSYSLRLRGFAPLR